MSSLYELISDRLDKNKKSGIYREIPNAESIGRFQENNSSRPADASDKLNYNTGIINLATNDYLGLSRNERVKKSAAAAIEKYGTSASSSFLVYGHFGVHKALENELLDFKGGYSGCILYPSGFQANTGTIKAIASLSPLKTFIAFDELSHASIVDGILSSGARFKSFKHNRADSLYSILEKNKNSEIKVVITEGVFSMEGDIPDLPKIMSAARESGAMVIVDDAHATGTIGPNGGGSAEHHGTKPDIIIGTLGKALASGGAFVLASELITNYLINYSRPFIFSTGIPPSSAAAALEAIKIIREEPALVSRLKKTSEFARNFFGNTGLNTLSSSTHIIPILIGEENKVVSLEKELLRSGIYLKGIRYPAVPKGEARLRLSINAGIDPEILDNALKKIASVVSSECS